MTIGIDIDDTITNTSEYANSLLKKYKKYSYVKDYHDLNEKDRFRFFIENVYDIHNNCTLKQDAIEVLKWLNDNGWRIVLITARGNSYYYEDEIANRIMKDTNDYLCNNKIYYDKIVFHQYLKSDVCVKEKVDIFIDDKEFILDDVAKKGIRTLRMVNNDEESKHQTVNSWKEIKKILSEVMNNE